MTVGSTPRSEATKINLQSHFFWLKVSQNYMGVLNISNLQLSLNVTFYPGQSGRNLAWTFVLPSSRITGSDSELSEKYWPRTADSVGNGEWIRHPQRVRHSWVALRVQVPASLIQVYNLITNNIQGCGGLDGAPRGAGVHKHLRYVVAKVDLAVGCDGLVLHQLEVLRR